MRSSSFIPSRDQQDPSVQWDIGALYADDAAWESAMDSCRSLPDRINEFRGTLGASPEGLLRYLLFSEQLDVTLNSLLSYPSLRRDEDTADPVRQARDGRAKNFAVSILSALSFEGPELAAIPEDTLESFYKKCPELERFRRYITLARLNREHTLPASEERLLASMGNVFRAGADIFGALTNADLKFPDASDSSGSAHPVTLGSFRALLSSPDRTLREGAFRSLYGVYGGLSNCFAAMLNAEVQKNVSAARVRGYDSALQAALLPSEIPESVYHNLLTAVNAGLDKLHRYMSLRKAALGLPELHMYDLYTPMVPDAPRDIPFEDARSMVLEAAGVLGEDYVRAMSSAFEERWIDIYENRGKRSGAYSRGCRVHPFILMNYTGGLDSVFTLAHELGHAMHSYFSTKTQSTLDSHYVLFVAEVASTCGEALLMYSLLKRTTDKLRRAALINHFLEQFRTTLYRQTMFAEFELACHRLVESGETLTAKRLCGIYMDLNRLYYGPDVVLDEGIAMEWARVHHFYRNFYVYQYATGFSAAMALSRRIMSGGEDAVADYLGFLSGGASADPVTLLRSAGVDMSTPRPVSDALDLFGSLLDEMESLLASIKK